MFDHILAPDTYLHSRGCDNMTALIVNFDFITSKRTYSNRDEDVENSYKKSKTEDSESEPQIDTTTL